MDNTLTEQADLIHRAKLPLRLIYWSNVGGLLAVVLFMFSGFFIGAVTLPATLGFLTACVLCLFTIIGGTILLWQLRVSSEYTTAMSVTLVILCLQTIASCSQIPFLLLPEGSEIPAAIVFIEAITERFGTFITSAYYCVFAAAMIPFCRITGMTSRIKEWKWVIVWFVLTAVFYLPLSLVALIPGKFVYFVGPAAIVCCICALVGWVSCLNSIGRMIVFVPPPEENETNAVDVFCG